MKKILIPVLIILLTGCGKESVIEYVDVDKEAGVEVVTEYVEVEVPVEVITETDNSNYDDTEFKQLSNTNTTEDRKIIYRADLRLESLDIDDVYDQVLSKINTYDAYAENEYVSLNRFTMKIRVRTANFTNFIESLKGAADVISYNKTSEDITTKYSTFVAKKEALEAEHVRVLELIKTAEKLEDIIALEEFRAEIESELNYIGNELNKYDSLIEYSTLNLTVEKANEPKTVTKYSEVPGIKVIKRNTDSVEFKVFNNSEENVASIYVTISDNGEIIDELTATNLKPDTYEELTVNGLEDDKEYKISVYSKEKGYDDSKINDITVKTKASFGTELSNGFSDSIDSLVTLSKGLMYIVVTLAPYLVILGVVSVPIIITMKNKRK